MLMAGTGCRRLIVNADDFGRSHGINRGVFASHAHGIVTSASLMVRWPAVADAVAFARRAPALGLGLHLDLGEWAFVGGGWRCTYEVVDASDPGAVRDEIWRQVERFDHLYGAYPSHLDSHQHVHRSEPARSALLGVAAELGVVVRDEDPRVASCGDFYGQDGRGEPNHEAITRHALMRVVTSVGPGATELVCHPGLGDDSGSVYAHERDEEVAALCHPAVGEAIRSCGIALSTFRSLTGAADEAPSVPLSDGRLLP